jgi:hypothetical protein
MGINYGPPPIVTKGLIFAVDVIDLNCYPGSGTTITDLVGSNAGTMNNSPTIESSPTKHINMSDNSGTVEFTDYKPTTFHGTSFTLEFFYTDTNGSNKGIFSQGIGFQVFAHSRRIISYQSSNAGNTYFVSGTANNTYGTNGVWRHYVMTRNGSTITFYSNGSEDGTITGLSDTVSATNQTHQYLGGYNTSSQLYNGDMGPVRTYNRPLTLAEVQQNFNAQRGRFGI